MSKRISLKLVRKLIAGLAMLLILLQGPLFTLANPQDPIATAPPPSDTLEGYSVTVKSTEEVNAFLASSTGGNRFLDGLNARGIYPGGVNYISLAGDAADPNNDLTLLASKINAGGGPRVSSVDMLIGAYQGNDGKLDAEVLLVANLARGGQRLLSGFQANDDNLNGVGEPVAYDGDYFASSAAQNATNAVAIGVLLCWIRCYVIQQIIIKLRCVIITIIACIRIGPFLICAKAQLIACQLIIIIRTIVVCYINCVVIVVIVPVPVVPVKPNGAIGALDSPPLDSGGRHQKGRPLQTGFPFRQPDQATLAS